MSEETLFDESGNFVDADIGISMVECAEGPTAMLSVRYGASALTADRLRRIATACEQAAAMLEGGA